MPNLVLIVPEKSIKLTVNDLLRRHLSKDGKNITLKNQVIAGAGAGFCQVSKEMSCLEDFTLHHRTAYFVFGLMLLV